MSKSFFALTSAAALAALLTAGAALAHDYKVGSVVIDHPWSRATAPGAANAAAYFTLTNTGGAPDRLLSASTPAAGKAELHTHLMDNGVMRMRPVEAIDVAPGTPATLAPGGLHVMLLGLAKPLEKGQSFPLTLVFEKGGSVTVEVSIQGAGDAQPAHGGHGQPKS